MRFSASEFYSYFSPEICDARVFLQTTSIEQSEPSAYSEVLKSIGVKFEREYLSKLSSPLDLSGYERDVREQKTIEAMQRKEAIIYQPAFSAITEIANLKVQIIGDPDFLILDGDGYLVRDIKLARRISEEDHPEILRQIELYGWLYEQVTGHQPKRLQAYSSQNELINIPYDGGHASIRLIEHILKIRAKDSVPYSPVGWSKCGPCGYKGHCWKLAEDAHDVALVYGVDQNLTSALRQSGVVTYEQLIENFSIATLADFKKPWGSKTQRVGKSSEKILAMAKSLRDQSEIFLAKIDLPIFDNYVMFDLEGLPPQMDELQKIYLWGVQVFGNQQGQFLPSTADFGSDGDKLGWLKFLKNAERIFGEYGEIPFVHWHHYERVNLEIYVDRYGDVDGIADRVLENMLDILPIVRESIALPLPSYSLKVIEKYLGFRRTQSEYGGDWSIAKYIEATETQDIKLRDEIMESILTYNREDLAATWAVFSWLKSKELQIRAAK